MKKDNFFSVLFAIYCFYLPFEYMMASMFGTLHRILGYLIIIYSFLRYGIKTKIFRVHILLLIWLLLMLVSFVWSQSSEWWLYFIRKYGLFVLLVLAVENIDIKRINRKLILNFLVAGAVIASLILVLFPSASNLNYEGRRTLILFGNQIDPNILAASIMIGLVVLFGKLFNEEGKMVIKLVLCGVCAFGILLTGSRGALIATVISLVVELLLYSKQKGMKTRSIFIILISGISVLFILSYLPEDLLQLRFSKDSVLGLNEFRNGSHNRYTIWMYSLIAFIKKPILGFGCGNFFTAIESVYRHCASHNLFILILVEGGIVGFILFFSYLIKYLRTQFRLRDFSMLPVYLSALLMSVSLDSLSYKYFWVAIIIVGLECRIRERELVDFEVSNAGVNC